jgi:hypothetical protein
MSKQLIAAAIRLSDTMAAENAALAALDLPRAAAMLAAKQQAAAAFIAAQDAPLVAAQRDSAEMQLRRLHALAAENRTLLERAIAVQSRVIGVIARAATPAITASGYGAPARSCHASRPACFALSARA